MTGNGWEDGREGIISFSRACPLRTFLFRSAFVNSQWQNFCRTAAGADETEKSQMTWTDAKIARLDQPGMHNVAGGLGLYVHVTQAGSKSYVARYRYGGTRPEMGLGSTRFVSLREATLAALEIGGSDRSTEQLHRNDRAPHAAAHCA
jgi:hypothetical protein